MERLLEFVAGWDAGHQLALLLGALALAGFVLLVGLASLGRTLCILRQGYPPPAPPVRLIEMTPWQTGSLPPRRPGQRPRPCPATLRLFEPEEPA
jgi:hypothetical protein